MGQPNSKRTRRSDDDGTWEIFFALHAHPNGRCSQSFVQSSPTRWEYGELSYLVPLVFHVSLFSRFMQIAAYVPPKSWLEDVLLL